MAIEKHSSSPIEQKTPGSGDENSGFSEESTSQETSNRELIERFIDAHFEQLLERSEKVNEGNNGVIAYVRIEILDEKDPDVVTEDIDGAVKVMKLYRPGRGREEYEHHVEAAKLVEAHDSSDKPLAMIPGVFRFRDLEISEDLRGHVVGLAPTLENESRMEAFFMDFIDGRDLATILYEKVLEHHPRLVHLKAEDLPFEVLQREVALALEFRIPGGKSRDENERLFEEQKVYQENAQILYSYLAKLGLQLHPGILERVNNTMDLLHAHGLVHRDSHDRNIMVAGDPWMHSESDPSPDVFLIDFGSAKRFERPIKKGETEVYRDEEMGETRIYPRDDRLELELGQILFSKPSERGREKKRLVAEEIEINRFRAMIASGENPRTAKWRAFIEQASAVAPDDGVEALSISIERLKPSEPNLELGAKLLRAALEELLDRRPGTRDSIAAMLLRMKIRKEYSPALERLYLDPILKKLREE